MQDVQDREVVTKLFDTIAPRFAARPGGYTRLLRIGFRKGDSAEMAQVELVGSEFDPKAKAEGEAAEAAKPKAKGVGGPSARGGRAAAREEGRRRGSAEGVDQAGERRGTQGHDAEKSRWQLEAPAVADVAWAFQILAATQFFLTGLDKLSDAPGMVQLFATVGFGQWFRYVDRRRSRSSARSCCSCRAWPPSAPRCWR